MCFASHEHVQVWRLGHRRALANCRGLTPERRAAFPCTAPEALGRLLPMELRSHGRLEAGLVLRLVNWPTARLLDDADGPRRRSGPSNRRSESNAALRTPYSLGGVVSAQWAAALSSRRPAHHRDAPAPGVASRSSGADGQPVRGDRVRGRWPAPHSQLLPALALWVMQPCHQPAPAATTPTQWPSMPHLFLNIGTRI